jgi:hypothetical protein
MSGRFFRGAALGLGCLALGAAGSRLKLWYQCREPASEACAWGRAYWPLTLPIETVVFGAVALGVFFAARALRKR